MSCTDWCQRSFHASQAQSSPCIMSIQSWRWIKPWQSKELLENLQCCPALTYRQMCTLHGVLSVGAQLVRERLHWRVLHNLRERRVESIYIIFPTASQNSLSMRISTKAWSGWPCHRVFKAWVLAADLTKAWSRWPCHRAFKTWVLASTLTKAWSGWPCHRAFKAWVLAGISTKAWSGWPCHRVFKAWVLAMILTKAWSGWPCHRVFKAWVLVVISTEAWSGWPCHRASKAWVLAMILTKAWSGWPCH